MTHNGRLKIDFASHFVAQDDFSIARYPHLYSLDYGVGLHIA